MATLNTSATVTFNLSRREIAWIAVGEVLLIVTASALTRWWIKRRSMPKPVAPPPPLDVLQEHLMRLLWVQPANCWKFEDLRSVVGSAASEVRLACQRLQTRGLVACNPHDPNTLVQLLSEGRELANTHNLTNADVIYARHPDAETLKIAVETPRGRTALHATYGGVAYCLYGGAQHTQQRDVVVPIRYTCPHP